MAYAKALVVLLLLWPSAPYAKPILAASDGEVTITLYDEPCKAKEVGVSNLAYRAVWKDKKMTSEGCWHDAGSMLVFYWQADKTVGLVPAQAFKPLAGA